MRYGEKIEATFKEKQIKINWRNKRLVDKIMDISEDYAEDYQSLQDELEKHEKALSNGELDEDKRDEIEQKVEELTEQAEQKNAEYIREQSDVMFEFSGGLPPVEWFADDEFSEPQFRYLQKVFMNPADHI